MKKLHICVLHIWPLDCTPYIDVAGLVDCLTAQAVFKWPHICNYLLPLRIHPENLRWNVFDVSMSMNLLHKVHVLTIPSSSQSECHVHFFPILLLLHIWRRWEVRRETKASITSLMLSNARCNDCDDWRQATAMWRQLSSHRFDLHSCFDIYRGKTLIFWNGYFFTESVLPRLFDQPK